MMTAPLPSQAIERFLLSLDSPLCLLVAISGGSDSTGLLVLLKDALDRIPSLPVRLVAATVDHALRSGSAEEAQAVADLCRRLGIPHTIERWSGDKPNTGIAAAAREARHALLARAAAALGANAIVTGHTLDDQIETVAMRRQRSAGGGDGDGDGDGPGLAGMAGATLYDGRIWVLRPLLCCRRADIRAALADRAIGWIDDPSNEDPRYERVRTRRAIAAGPGTAPDPEAGHRRAALSCAAAQVVRRHATAFAGPVIRLSHAALQEDRAALRHALAALIGVAGGRSHLPGRDLLDRAAGFASGATQQRITLARALLVRRPEGLFLLRERRDLPALTLEPGESALWDGRFRIANRSPEAVEIIAGATLPVEGLPGALARHAAAILPRTAGLSGAIDCRPAIGPYERFLPLFDLALAGALAAVIGRENILPPPFSAY